MDAAALDAAALDAAALDAAAADARAGNVADADLPDAAAVGCTGDEDCQDPDDACLLAGTCNPDTGECEFPAKDCSDFDGECTEGVCVDGTCDAEPINEDASCGEGTTCDGFGSCVFDGDTCSTEGEKTRSCRDFTCTSGACTAGVDYEDTDTCSRNTNGVTCGNSNTSCGSCGGFSSTCDTTGTRDCTRTEFECGNGTCQEIQSSFTQSCTRNTNGADCGSSVTDCGGCGSFSDSCDETGSRSCTCSDKVCSGGSCVIDGSSSSSCTRSCSRDTDGNGCVVGGCTTGFCSSGSCVNTCN